MKLKQSTYVHMVLLGFCLFFVAGCASVKFYEENNDSIKETGYLYYPPKPYLLVEQGEKGAVTKLISLPDLERPHRVKQSGWLGSSELGFTTANGMLMSFNSKIDSKVPETISSVAELGTAYGGILGGQATLLTAELTENTNKALFAGTVGSDELLYDVVPIIKAEVGIGADVLSKLNGVSSTHLKAQITALQAQQSILSPMRTIKFNKNKPKKLIETLEEYRKKTGSVVLELKGVQMALEIYANNPEPYEAESPMAKTALVPLKKIISNLASFSSRSSSIYGLYEIDFINGQLVLKKVAFE